MAGLLDREDDEEVRGRRRERAAAQPGVAGYLNRAGQAVGDAYDYFLSMPDRIRQQTYDYAVSRGVDPAMAASAADRVASRAGRTTGAVEFLMPQTAGDVALMAAGPLGRMAPAAGRAALALGGGLLGMEPSEAEAGRGDAVARGARNVVQRAVDAVTGVRAYHGSPHDYDRFDISKIGTGEGAQAYGAGGYFGEASDTGRSYRDALLGRSGTDPNMRIGSKPLNDYYSDMERRLANMPAKQAQEGYNRLSLLEDLGLGGDVLHVREQARAGAYSPETLSWFEQEIAPRFSRTGRLYEVNLNVDPKNLVNWDAPIVQQPAPAVGLFERLAKIPQTGSARVVDREILPVNQVVDLRTPEVAQQLREVGVPGIRYLDQGSRGAGEGTRNYVMFDDSLISILRKYGLAPGMIGGGTAAGLLGGAGEMQ